MNIESILDWLNENYNQNSEKYNVFTGAKREVIRLDEHTAISFWGCGAIVCDKSCIRFIHEDDGHWFIVEETREWSKYKNTTAGEFSIAWAKGFAKAMDDIVNYVEENGTPVYFSGHEGDSNFICHYTL